MGCMIEQATIKSTRDQQYSGDDRLPVKPIQITRGKATVYGSVRMLPPIDFLFRGEWLYIGLALAGTKASRAGNTLSIDWTYPECQSRFTDSGAS
jgi:hypothetical protein